MPCHFSASNRQSSSLWALYRLVMGTLTWDRRSDSWRLFANMHWFQGRERRPLYPIHRDIVVKLLSFSMQPHYSCKGPSGGCRWCIELLHGWRDCLSTAVLTIGCCRTEEGACLQLCDFGLTLMLRRVSFNLLESALSTLCNRRMISIGAAVERGAVFRSIRTWISSIRLGRL